MNPDCPSPIPDVGAPTIPLHEVEAKLGVSAPPDADPDWLTYEDDDPPRESPPMSVHSNVREGSGAPGSE